MGGKKKNKCTQIILRTCVRKNSYSKQGADDYITEKLKEGKVLYYYKCIFCGRYHISKKDNSPHTIDIIGG